MKKVLGISLVAVLAVSPMMANASQVTPFATPITASPNFATTSYVKGAYNELATHVNSKQDQLKAGGVNIDTTVKTSIATGVGEDTASETALLTEKAVYDAIANAKQAAIDSASGDASAISSLIAGQNEALVNSFEAETIVGALNELAGDISDEATARADADDALDGRLDTAEGEIDDLQTAVNTLNGGVNDSGSVEYKINQAITNVNTTTSGLGDRVTAIEGKQITYVTTWNDELNTTVTKTISQLP